MAKEIFIPISVQTLECLCKALAETITGSEIGNYLVQLKFEDVDPQNTKWKRLFNSFANNQNKTQASNDILKFIQTVLSPVRFAHKNEEFKQHLISINLILSFIGFELLENGKFKKIEFASTISEAQKRADKLKSKLQEREVHNDVQRFCIAELLVENYFHAVLETSKSLADKIREKSSLSLDGVNLIEKAFGVNQNNQINSPILQFNNLVTDSEKNEHKGFTQILKGVFAMFRNTTAHEPRIFWEINEQDALDYLTLASMLHRKLDNCRKNVL